MNKHVINIAFIIVDCEQVEEIFFDRKLNSSNNIIFGAWLLLVIVWSVVTRYSGFVDAIE